MKKAVRSELRDLVQTGEIVECIAEDRSVFTSLLDDLDAADAVINQARNHQCQGYPLEAGFVCKLCKAIAFYDKRVNQ